MTTIDNIRACVELRAPEMLPVFALSQEFDARYCGLTYSEYIRDAQTVVGCQLNVIEKFGWDWSWLHLDDTLEFEPLGVGVAAGENVVPATTNYLPFTRKVLSALRVPDPKTSARMPLLLDAIAGLREARGDQTCITGRVAAPFSAVTLIFGMQESFYMMVDNPKLFKDALKFAEEQATSWGLAQIEAGAHALWYGDCNASMHLISPGLFEQWALEPCRRVCQTFKEAGAFVWLHNSEENMTGLRLQALTEPSALSHGPALDRAAVAAEFRGKLCTIGNVDPIQLLQLGSASQVAAETDRQVRLMADGGMILNSGECIPREAKAPNLHVMADSAHKVWALIKQH
ncbi:MAG: uroporphyrinogen decarboxylase family protein [Armatimonadota bacterium]